MPKCHSHLFWIQMDQETKYNGIADFAENFMDDHTKLKKVGPSSSAYEKPVFPSTRGGENTVSMASKWPTNSQAIKWCQRC